MLTRLTIKGFKNLVDVDLRFGPLTCIAGPNGVGKSNLFDAICFLSNLAEKSILEAATGVREDTSSANAGRIFTQGKCGASQEMRLVAEMIVPVEVKDDLDQSAKTSITSLRYTIGLRLHHDDSTIPRIELTEECLDYISKTEMKRDLLFQKSADWVDSVLVGRRTKPLISTEKKGGYASIKLHEDSGHQGRAQGYRADSLKRTLLSTVNTAENPTALAAKRELQSWKLLQLEPARLRSSDSFHAHAFISPDGQHLPATLYRLLSQGSTPPEDVKAKIVNRLSSLIQDVHDLRIDRDISRELQTLYVQNQDGFEFRARDLSDGTLRFLALAILEADPAWNGLICMEEPENGIHPTRINAMLELVRELALDCDFKCDETNPLRQVIFNTHSPEVLGLASSEDVLFAKSGIQGQLTFHAVRGSWRNTKWKYSSITKSEMLEFLQPMRSVIYETPQESPRILRVAEQCNLWDSE